MLRRTRRITNQVGANFSFNKSPLSAVKPQNMTLVSSRTLGAFITALGAQIRYHGFTRGRNNKSKPIFSIWSSFVRKASILTHAQSQCTEGIHIQGFRLWEADKQKNSQETFLCMDWWKMFRTYQKQFEKIQKFGKLFCFEFLFNVPGFPNSILNLNMRLTIHFSHLWFNLHQTFVKSPSYLV